MRSKSHSVLLRAMFAAGSVILMFFLIFGDPIVLWNNQRLKQQVLTSADKTVVLHQLTPFQWDEVYTFSPYTSKEEIARCIGFSSPSIKETVSEEMTQLLFVRGKRVVSSVCAYPSGIGYGVSGLPSGQAVRNKPDSPRFRLEKRGDIVWLEYLP